MTEEKLRKNKFKIAFLFLGLFFLFSFVFVNCQAATTPASSSSMQYTPMESIPGFGAGASGGKSAPVDFPTYVSYIYKFCLWTVGVAALLMITVGGFMYIASAGNNAATSKAKGYITDAIIGLIMALTAWILLNTINPSLLTITKLTGPAAGTASTAPGSSTTSPSSAPTAAQQQQNQQDCTAYCAGGGSDTSVDQNTCNTNCMAAKAAQQPTTTSNSNPVTGGNCSQINDAINNNNQGVPPATLKAVMGGGEGCNPAVSSDGLGSCGYSQALPATRTACGITGTAQETCAKIQADPNLDVNCAAQTINNMQTYSKGACDPNDPVAAGCCYNGGQSNSDCHKNPAYATKVNNYISKYGTN